MKKLGILLLLCLLLTHMVIPAALGETAARENPLRFKIDLSSSTLTEPREITVFIQISNTGDEDMPGSVVLLDPDKKAVTEWGEPVLAAGATKTWTGTLYVTQEMLDAGKVTYYCNYYFYNEEGELKRYQKPFSQPITHASVVTSCEINRTILPTTAYNGQEVTITYDVINQGTAEITNVEIAENKSISSTKGTIASVPAGEKRSYVFTVKMAKKDLTSSPTITYMSDDKAFTVTKDAVTIKYGEMNLTGTLTADKVGGVTGEVATLTLTLKNTGKTDYENIAVSDATLGDVFSGETVPAGGSLVLTKTVPINVTTDYQFAITGTSSDGVTVDTATGRVTVKAIAPDQVVNLHVVASFDRTTIYTTPDVLRVTVSVSNQSAEDVSSVAVLAVAADDGNDITLYTFDKIAAGETKEFVRDVSVSMGGLYQFAARVRNQLGQYERFQSDAVRIYASEPTPVPTEAPIITPYPPEYTTIPSATSLNDAQGRLINILRGIGIALLCLSVIGIALVVVSAVRRHQANRPAPEAKDQIELSLPRDYSVPHHRGDNSILPDLDDDGEEPAYEYEPEPVSEDEAVPAEVPAAQKSIEETPSHTRRSRRYQAEANGDKKITE